MVLSHFRSSLKIFKPQLLLSLKSSKGVLQRWTVVAVEHRLSKSWRREKLSSLDHLLSPSTSNSHSYITVKLLLGPPTNYLTLCKSTIPFTTFLSNLGTNDTDEGENGLMNKTETSGEGTALAAEDQEKVVPEKMQGKEEQQRRCEEGKKIRTAQDIEQEIGPPPEKPLAGDCCGQGCELCVWDVYWDQVAEYNKIKKAAEETLEGSE